jgi:site-specific recombinase XerD
MNALKRATTDYLTYLAAHGYATSTVRGRRYHLDELTRFLEARDVIDPRQVTPSVLESYQRHLFHHQKRDGTALSFRTQAQRLVPVKSFFSYLAKTGAVFFDPALALTLPKTERRLPEAVLNVEEVEAVLAGPDTTTPLGLRDRAILEVFYSTAIRRMELINLHVSDIDMARGSLFVRQGKGARDRFVPIGERARYWVARYLHEVRPQLQYDTRHATLFLSTTGRPLVSDVLTRLVGAIHSGGRRHEEGQRSPLSPHHRHVDVGRRGRRAPRRRDARTPEARHDDAVHESLDGQAPGSARSVSPGGAGRRGQVRLSSLRYFIKCDRQRLIRTLASNAKRHGRPIIGVCPALVTA